MLVNNLKFPEFMFDDFLRELYRRDIRKIEDATPDIVEGILRSLEKRYARLFKKGG